MIRKSRVEIKDHEILKELRERKDISLDKFAKDMEISLSEAYNIESGAIQLSYAMISKFCKYYDVSIRMFSSSK